MTKVKVTIVPVPTPLLESPLFGQFAELQILNEENGGLPIPLKHNAILQVLALKKAIKTEDPDNFELVEDWAAALGVPNTHEIASPRAAPVSLPGSSSPSPRVPSSPFVPVQCVPEHEPDSENHSIYPTVYPTEKSTARFVPIPLNPVYDETLSSPQRTAVALPAASPVAAPAALPGSPVKKTGPLSSPPLNSAPTTSAALNAAVAETTKQLQGLGLGLVAGETKA